MEEDPIGKRLRGGPEPAPPPSPLPRPSITSTRPASGLGRSSLYRRPSASGRASNEITRARRTRPGVRPRRLDVRDGPTLGRFFLADSLSVTNDPEHTGIVPSILLVHLVEKPVRNSSRRGSIDEKGVSGDQRMSDPSTAQVVTSWRTLLEAGSVAAMTDVMLLERFATRRDAAAETAFAALVARHGPMVRQVCRRLLVDPDDAEDAFQATFFVLARRAATIRHPERLSSWLYGTAYRTSRKLRAQSARRHRLEAGAARPEPASGTDPGRIEEIEIVLEEVDRLPDACRAAVVLCGLEGWTQDAAARSLGCSDRTLRRRLNQAHGLLRARLDAAAGWPPRPHSSPRPSLPSRPRRPSPPPPRTRPLVRP